MVKSSLTPEQLKRAKEIYAIASNMNLKDRREYLKSLSVQERDLYNKESNKARQAKFNLNSENKEKLNEHRRKYIEEQRKEQPEVFKERNVKDVKNFRLREKEKLDNIQKKLKSVDVLTNALKNKKARMELQKLKQDKLNQVKAKVSAVLQSKSMIDNIFSNVIDKIPVKRKRGRPVGSKNKAKPKVVEPSNMNLRPRPKKS